MTKHICPILLSTIIVFTGNLFAQTDSDAKLISAPGIKIPDAVFNAGISGTVVIAISVDRSGSAKSARIIGGPTWPCGSNPADELKALHQAIIDSMLAAKFSPQVKNGNPVDSELKITYAVKPRINEDASGTADGPRLIKSGVVNGRALRLVKPPYPPEAKAYRASGPVSVEVTIDEEGKVEKAGAIIGHPTLHQAAREAACLSTFTATKLQGTAVKVSGVITYVFQP